MLKGNSDTYSVKKNQLDIPIVGANVLRVVPFSQYMRTVCLRFELFGCPYQGKLYKIQIIQIILMIIYKREKKSQLFCHQNTLWQWLMLFQLFSSVLYVVSLIELCNIFLLVLWLGGPVAYHMSDGFFGGRFGDLIDDSYDGVRSKNGYLSGGLGKLFL